MGWKKSKTIPVDNTKVHKKLRDKSYSCRSSLHENGSFKQSLFLDTLKYLYIFRFIFFINWFSGRFSNMQQKLLPSKVVSTDIFSRS